MPECKSDKQDLFDINLNQLHEELVKQVQLYGEWSGKLADARRDLTQSEAVLELVEAELDKSIRDNPNKFYMADERLTEGRIKHCIRMQKEYKDAQANYLLMKHRTDVFAGKVATIDRRGMAIGKLVELRLADYFSETRARGKPHHLVGDMASDRAFGTRNNEG